MEYLIAEDSLLATVMDQVAAAHQLPENTLPTNEIGCFFRYLLNKEKEIEQALAEVVRYSLTAANIDEVIARMQRISRKELQPYIAGDGGQLGGIGDPAHIDDPCRQLLLRKLQCQ